MKKMRDECVPDHVKQDYTYEEEVQAVLAEGWPLHMVEEIVHGRKGQRSYFRRIIHNRQYYKE